MRLKNYTKPLILLLGAFILFNACKKKSDSLVLPDQINANQVEPNTDSLLIVTSSIVEDSFETDKLPYQLLGAMHDPNFGRSKSEVYSQFTITDLQPDLTAAGNNLDSAILTIRYTSKTAFYGNLTTAQEFTVHRLTEDFPSSSDRIFSSQQLAFDPTPIGTFNGIVDLKDSTVVRQGTELVKVAPSFKVKLTSAFASTLFNAPAGSYDNDAAFKSFFKGIVIRANTSHPSAEGAVFALSVDDPLSKITIHYNDSLAYALNMKSSRKFTNYTIVDQNSSITSQHTNPLIDYNRVYAQSLTGSKIRIEIPNLIDLANSKTSIVHKAELIIKPLSGSFSSTYPLPQRLLVLQPDDSGKSISIPDLFSGKFNGALTSNEDYVLNVTDFIQFQLNNYKSTGILRNVLHIVVPNSDPIAPSRLIVDADKTVGQPKIALRIVLSEP